MDEIDENEDEDEEEKDFESQWIDLCQLVRQLPRLKSLTFQGRLEIDNGLVLSPMGHDREDLWENLRRQSIPSTLIRALQKHQPDCELHVKGWIRCWENKWVSDETELALQASPNLRSLELLVTDVHHDGEDFFLQALNRIIVNAPDLKQVRFGLADACYPDSLPGDEWDALDLEGKPYQYLQWKKQASAILPSLTTDHRYANNVLLVIDDPTLEYLDIGRVHWHNFFTTTEGVLNSRFHSLLHLYIGVDNSYQGLLDDPYGVWGDIDTYTGTVMTVKDRKDRPILAEELFSFLKACNHLETLYLQFWEICTSKDKMEIFSRHGPTLKKFHIMDGFNPCTKTTRSNNHRDLISFDQLREINTVCPLLEDLGIVVFHSDDGDTELKIFNEIAKFQNLRRVTLIMDLHRVKGKIEKLLNNPLCLDYEDSAQRIWSLLRCSEEKKSKIKELKIIVGEWVSSYWADVYHLQCGRLEWENPVDNHIIIAKENLAILTDDKTVLIKEGK